MVAGQHGLDDPMGVLCYVWLADEIVLDKNSLFDRRSVENLLLYVNLNDNNPPALPVRNEKVIPFFM
jgi:hypothetical protein